MKCSSCGFEHTNPHFFLKVSIPMTFDDVVHKPDFRVCPKCGVVFDSNLSESAMHKNAMASG